MPEQQRRNTRRNKIEPLNYAEAALAPALKGLISFLDVTPEDVRNGNFVDFGEHSAASQRNHAATRLQAESETAPGDETPPAAETAAPIPQPKIVHSRRPVTPITAKRKQVAEIQPAGQIDSGVDSSPAGVLTPGDETPAGDISYAIYADDIAFAITPGRGRSKIRRCVLAQDGHSLGEEAIYQALWRTGRPENSDPNGSRTNRMGAADIGFKVNMSKKNVRQNISRLFEKLSIEIIENFETMNSQARLYRVYSYKQILERRRAAGLEYVLRNKGVVFCTQDGTALVSSPAYVSSPGGKTSIKPALPKKRRTPVTAETPRYPQTPSATTAHEVTEDADLQLVSQALNRYWSVDQAAAVQLLRDCRRVRHDARADEIAFFVQEKLELARTSRTITNPTGLILATVPQSFVGSTFDDFRRRLERRAKLAAEEEERRRQDQAELTAWIMKDRERFEAIVSDPSKSEKERDEAERRLREIASWDS